MDKHVCPLQGEPGLIRAAIANFIDNIAEYGSYLVTFLIFAAVLCFCIGSCSAIEIYETHSHYSFCMQHPTAAACTTFPDFGPKH